MKDRSIAELKEWLISIGIAALLALFIQTSIVQPHEVVGPSMLPTLVEGQRILVNKFIYRFHPPNRGDVIILKYPRTDQNFVKRVIGIGGDTIAIQDGLVLLNGVPLNEPYILEPTRGTYRSAVVPQGHLFVMGDNRNNSDDSRFTVGFLPLDLVTGRAEAVIWPLPAVKLLRNGLP